MQACGGVAVVVHSREDDFGNLIVGKRNARILADGRTKRWLLVHAKVAVDPCLNGFKRCKLLEGFHSLLVRHNRLYCQLVTIRVRVGVLMEMFLAGLRVGVRC